ncbi:hypothetical protein BG003_009852 [Podila horticola]|nr:hypothetical protein BG003_009852 [Podila horticola]
MLSFERDHIDGAAATVSKIVRLPFSNVAQSISTKDAQLVGEDIIILVTGQLIKQTEGETNAQMFT